MKNLIVILTTFLSISAGYNLTYSQVGPEWVQRYDGAGNGFDQARSIAVDGSGNIYVTGLSDGSGTSSDFATIKYNSLGIQQWVQRYDGPGNSFDQAISIAVDNLGYVYVTGESANDFVTIKYSSSGVEQWVRRYNGTGGGYDRVHSIAVDGSGNVYVTGQSEGSVSYDYATIKYNSNGDSLWVQRYGGEDVIELPWSIAVDNSGNVYVTGGSSLPTIFESITTIKYNSSGVQQWVRTYSNSSEGRSIAVDGSGNVYVTGYYSVGYNNHDFVTIKYDSNGDSLWVQIYNGPGNESDVANSIKVDGSGYVYVTGTSIGAGTATDYATIKYSSSGVQQWVQRYNGTGNSFELALSIAVDNSGNVYVTGTSEGNGTSGDFATIKYSSVPRTLHLTALIQGFYNNLTNTMLRDTVEVYLRNSTAPYGNVDSARTVLDSTGNGTFNFFNASNSTPYYIVIKHRNSIETWSSGGNSFLLNNLSYNFTTAANKAYGNNQKQIDSSPIQFGIYSGDVNQDGIVDASDVSDVDNDAFNFVSGYVRTDVNGNIFVDASDLSIVDNNAFDFVSIRRP